MYLWYVLASVTLARLCAMFIEQDRLTSDALYDMRLLWTFNVVAAIVFAVLFFMRLYQRYQTARLKE